jgi:alkylated DNA repair protein (DNA oxidative demethylase)
MGDRQHASGNLFASEVEPQIDLALGAVLLRGFALATERELMSALEAVVAAAPFRHMVTPGGQTMSVAMTNCGSAGWVTDRRGYRYQSFDPVTGRPWPEMPRPFLTFARNAAAGARYSGFEPDACLINRYMTGARLTLHQDRSERDFSAPIVSVSLGLPAKFLFGGLERRVRPQRVMLHHGDVVVWGGPSRLAYHGIDTLKDGEHPATGRCRINLTFRKAV